MHDPHLVTFNLKCPGPCQGQGLSISQQNLCVRSDGSQAVGCQICTVPHPQCPLITFKSKTLARLAASSNQQSVIDCCIGVAMLLAITGAPTGGNPASRTPPQGCLKQGRTCKFFWNQRRQITQKLELAYILPTNISHAMLPYMARG